MKILLRLLTCSLIAFSYSGTVTPAGEQAVVAQVATATAQAVLKKSGWKQFGMVTALNLPLAVASRQCIKQAQKSEEESNARFLWQAGAVGLNFSQDMLSAWVDRQFYPRTTSMNSGLLQLTVRSYLAHALMRVTCDVIQWPDTSRRGKLKKYGLDVGVMSLWPLLWTGIKIIDGGVPKTATERLSELAGDMVPYAVARAIS